MKIGVRKPSIKKSISARSTGKLTRSVKKITSPGYGRKGMGLIKNLLNLYITIHIEE